MANGLAHLTLVLGGARSGKSGFAERLALASGLLPVYLATAEARDAEMQARIADHVATRGPEWRTVETPLELGEAVRAEAGPGRVVLIDCLTLWLSNLMLASRDDEGECAAMLTALTDAGGPVICVSNELGLGLAPETPLGRRFRDAQGRLNQMVAAKAGLAVLVTAGLPMVLKGALPDGFAP